MKKNVIKEIIIVLLLSLAIILILGVLLYEFVPANKIIPETISYTTPANVQAELQTDENIDESEVVVTYRIDSTDLNNYKKTQEYVPGKKNPFVHNKGAVCQWHEGIQKRRIRRAGRYDRRQRGHRGNRG